MDNTPNELNSDERRQVDALVSVPVELIEEIIKYIDCIDIKVYPSREDKATGKELKKKLKVHYMMRFQNEVNKKGYAGILPNGNLVDRREHPEAIPVPKNDYLGIPEPKEVD